MSSKILVDELAGNTAAGNITVTSEGGSATMQLQQGLAKHFVAYQNDTTTAVLNSQSLNNSSLTDNATGNTSFNLTNNMAQVRYAVPDSGGDFDGGYATFLQDTSMSASSYQYYTANSSFNAQDSDFHSVCALGDLA